MHNSSVLRRRRLPVICAVLLVLGLLAAVTPPEPASSDVTPVSFTFGGGGDFGRSSNATGVLRAVGAGGLAFFTSVGDLSYADNSVYPESQWCQYVKDNLNAGAGKPVGDLYGETFPFQIVSGNHEAGFRLTEGGLIDNYLTPTCLPNGLDAVPSPHLGTNPSASGNFGKEYYFDHPTAAPLARFLMLSPRQNFLHGGLYDYSTGSPRLQWVSDRIDEARAAGIRWIVVGMHHNYITAGTKNDEVGSALMNLLISKKVDLILQGHDHTYQRSKQLSHSAACPSLTGSSTTAANFACVTDDGGDGHYPKDGGTVILIQGMGGVGQYATSTTDPQAPYFAKLMGNTTGTTGEVTFGYNRFTVSPTEMSSEFVRGAGGVFTDRFRIGGASPEPDTTPPTAPVNLRATAAGATRADLAWDAATDNTGVTSYDVYRDGARLTTVTGTTYADLTVSAGTTYTYTVRAKDAAGNVSPDSAPGVVTTPMGTSTTVTVTPAHDATLMKDFPTVNYGDAVALEADNSPVKSFLTKFTVTGTAGKRIDKAVLRLYVSNASNSGGVFRATTSTSWSQGTVTWATAPVADGVSLGTVPSVTAGRWVEVNLAPLVKGDGTYSIRASSTSTDGAGYNAGEAPSNKPHVVLTVAPVTIPPPADTTPPTAPVNLRATAAGATRADLAWDAATDNTGVTSYDVYRDGARLTTVTGTTYADLTVSARTTYTYTVRAKDAAGNVSPDSAPGVVTTPMGTSTTVTVTPAHDATLMKDFPTVNYGNAVALEADNSPVKSFLTKFTVTGTAGKRIDKAVLRLYVSNASNSGGVFRATTSTSWSQGTVTWATAPVADGVSLGTVPSVTAGRWVEVNLAPLVKGDGTYSIRASSTSTDGAGYNAGEAPSNKPHVVLTVSTP